MKNTLPPPLSRTLRNHNFCCRCNEILHFLTIGAVANPPAKIVLGYICASPSLGICCKPAGWIHDKNQHFFNEFIFGTYNKLQSFGQNWPSKAPFGHHLGGPFFSQGGGEFALGIMKYCQFWFVVRLWGWLWILHYGTFLQCLGWMLFANHWGEYTAKSNELSRFQNRRFANRD